MKKIFAISILLIPLALMSAEKPLWITSPFEFCPPTELCAVGEGTGAMGAEASARNALAKIFETKVISKSKFTTKGEQTQKNDVIKGSVTEDSSIEVEELTDEVLKGVVIKETYSDKTSFYALASLNKNKGSEAFKTEILSLDEKVKSLWQDGRRSSLSKILTLYKLREGLHFRYSFLKGDKIPKPVKDEDIFSKKRDKKKLETTLWLSFENFDQGDELKSLMTTLLTDQDYKVVRSEKLPHAFKVRASLVSTKQHMNVEGFEKYGFVLSLAAINKEGQELGHIEVEDTETGRNLKQAYENALPYLTKALKDKLPELNID